MLSKNTKPNAEEKAWLKAVADFHNEHGVGYLFGDMWNDAPFQIHHVCGRSYKQNKVKIGHWFILPVPQQLHDVHSAHPLNVTHYRKRFSEAFGNQRYLWRKMVEKMADNGIAEPESNISGAIMLTKY